jgi:hypothetical protein
MPPEMLTAQLPLPILFLRLVAVAELLGALGLVLPGLLRIRPGLTAIAAIELAHVMLGATLVTLATNDDPATAVLPAIVGALCTALAYARWRVIPLGARMASGRRISYRPAPAL